MKKRISKILLFVLILNLVVPQFVLAENLYKDQGDISSWAVDSVVEGSEKKIILGSDGYFKPKNNITRAEFTKLIVEVLNLENNNKGISFSDIKKSDWFYEYVIVAANNEIIKGANGKFNPNGKITREEMAVIISRALELKGENKSEILDSEKISKWAIEDVNRVMEAGLIQGSNNRFNPKDLATREMASVVIMRTYHYEDKKVEEKPVEKPIEKPVENKNITKALDNLVEYIKKTVKDPTVASIGGEWSVIGLNRSGRKVDSNFNENYLKNLEKILKEKEGKLHSTRYTEYSRVIIALNSIDKDPKNIFNYNLENELKNLDNVKKQGLNGPIYALIALNNKDVELNETKKAMIEFILEREIKSGGWSLVQTNEKADIDITAMAIQALAPYKDNDDRIKIAIDKAVEFLSKEQKSDGGYESWGSKNSENISQVIMALSSIGIDADKDERFIKNNNSLMDIFLSYQMENGGFKHEKDGNVNLMASEHAILALVSYEKFINNEGSLYTMYK